MTDHLILLGALILQGLETLLLIRILWQGEFIMKYEKGVYEVHTKKEVKREAWREAKRSAVIKKIEYEAAIAKQQALENVTEEENNG